MIGDLPVGQPAREEGEDLDLAWGQPSGTLTTTAYGVPAGGQHDLDRVAVQASRPDAGPQLGGGVVRRAWRSVRAWLAHRLVRIRRGEHAARRRYRRGGQSVRIAGPVQALTMLHGDGGDRRQSTGLPQHPLGEQWLQPDSLPLPGPQRP